jgi:hypothetical protein
LHGRLADTSPGPTLLETELVLSSAEFGDAYLRSGWASRYVYDLARAHTVVLVGYEADDPPMRYLLEVLESDRERFTDLREEKKAPRPISTVRLAVAYPSIS